jgi:hypothetical protein
MLAALEGQDQLSRIKDVSTSPPYNTYRIFKGPSVSMVSILLAFMRHVVSNEQLSS